MLGDGISAGLDVSGDVPRLDRRRGRQGREFGQFSLAGTKSAVGLVVLDRLPKFVDNPMRFVILIDEHIGTDVKGSQIGLPEVTLGLLPGGGGVTRTVRMLGIQNAFVNVLAQGTRFKPASGCAALEPNAICYFPEAAYDRSGIELFEREMIPALS
jgi:hypothetical protein